MPSMDVPSASDDDPISEEEARKRRELLNRRPSYRRILNDISDVELSVKKEHLDPLVESQYESSSGVPHEFIPAIALQPRPSLSLAETIVGTTVASNNNLTLFPQGLIPGIPMLHTAVPTFNGDLGTLGLHGAPFYNHHALHMPNDVSTHLLTPMKTELNLPRHLVGPGGMSPAQSPATSLISPSDSPRPLSATPPIGMGQPGDDSRRKREARLLKNREAAKECRRKKKEYVKCLENRVAVLENQNKALIDELKTLKDLYCRKGDSAI